MTKKPQNFRDKETEEFAEILKKYKDKFAKSETTSKKFLVELGVITEKGNRTKHYKHLCIPEVQG
ncbi:hypothetical protein SAMN05216436_106118 [bacterium A37T11]|nr:hypothetical protein SAMN05216436_106118 [bacterium A37T11]